MVETLNPESLIPHQGKMCLINKIIEITDQTVSCQVSISKDDIFYRSDINGVYSWVGIEYMAQTIGIYAGLRNDNPNPKKSKMGLLLSVRAFKTESSIFKLGQCLSIKGYKIYLEGNIGVFDCEIYIDNQQICSAKLNTILPENDQIDNILKGKAVK